MGPHRMESLSKSHFTALIKSTIQNLAEKNKLKDLDPFLKMHTFWSMLHGLISINMLNKENNEALNKMVLKDFIKGFVAGFQA